MHSHQHLRNEGYTHKGWFGICPVYLGNLDQEYCVKVAPRWWFVVPLFVVSEWWQGAIIYVRTWAYPEYEPSWEFEVTGELDGQ